MVNFGPLTADIGWWVWGTPANFNGFCPIGFVTAPTSLNGGQRNFAQCLAVSWAGTLYVHFRGSFLCVQVLCSPILSALLHGSRAVGVSKLRHSAQGATCIRQGGHVLVIYYRLQHLFQIIVCFLTLLFDEVA